MSTPARAYRPCYVRRDEPYSSKDIRYQDKERKFQRSDRSFDNNTWRIHAVATFSIEEQVKTLLQCRGGELSKGDSLRLCKHIKEEQSSLASVLNLLTGVKVTPYLVNALLVTEAKLSGESPWKFKKELFCQLPRRLQTIENLNCFITQADRQNDYRALYSAYIKATRLKLANTATYNSFISAAANAGYFDEVQSAYDEARRRLLIDAETYNKYMRAASDTIYFEKVMAAYNEACQKKCINEATFNIFMCAAKKAKRFDKVQIGYLDAIAAEQVNVVTHAIYIDAAGKAGHFDDANRAYRAACEEEKVNKITHASFLDAAARNGYYEIVKSSYRQLCAEGKVNKSAHMIYINCCWQMEDFAEARAVFQIQQFRPPFDIDCGTVLIDLHGFSHAAGFLAVQQYIDENPSCRHFKVICGKGSVEDGNYLTFRTELESFIADALDDWSCEAAANNEGVLILSRTKE